MHLLIATLVLVFVAACSERPPRPDPERAPSLNLQKGPNATAGRTLEQGESPRMRD